MRRTLAQAFVFRAIHAPLFQRLWVAYFHAMFGLQRHDEACIPRSRPLIFAGNHGSHWDGLFSITAMFEVLGEPPTMLAWGGVADFPGSREVVATAAVEVILTDPSSHSGLRGANAPVLRKALTALRRGQSVVLHAEGRRGDALGPFKGGAAFLARHTGAPIVPFTLRGVHGLWRNLPWPDRWHGSVSVHFHPAIDPAAYAHLLSRDATAAMTGELRRRVVSALDYPDSLDATKLSAPRA